MLLYAMAGGAALACLAFLLWRVCRMRRRRRGRTAPEPQLAESTANLVAAIFWRPKSLTMAQRTRLAATRRRYAVSGTLFAPTDDVQGTTAAARPQRLPLRAAASLRPVSLESIERPPFTLIGSPRPAAEQAAMEQAAVELTTGLEVRRIPRQSRVPAPEKVAEMAEAPAAVIGAATPEAEAAEAAASEAAAAAVITAAVAAAEAEAVLAAMTVIFKFTHRKAESFYRQY